MPSARLSFAAVLLLSAPAAAQAPPTTSSYEPMVVVSQPAPEPDALAAFEKLASAISAKSEDQLRAMLVPDFTALSCSTDPALPCAPGRVKSAKAGKNGAIDVLRLALCCGGRDDRTIPAPARTEAMFGVIESLLHAGKPARSAVLAGAVCLPALPSVDGKKLAILAKRVGIEASDLRIAALPVEARRQADALAPVAATLPTGAIVPVLASQAVPVTDGWTAVALPAGGIGYAHHPMLDEIAPESLCLRRGKDGWKLAVLVGRQ